MSRRIDRVSEARGIQRGTRVLATLQPFFTRDVVLAILRRDFPRHNETEVLDILKAYQRDSEKLSCRVHLDSMKLSEGNVEKLSQLISAAKEDFRDIVMPAENPRTHNMGVVAYSRLSDDEKDLIATEDLNDYLAWIQKP